MAGCKYVLNNGLFCPFPTGMMLFCSKKEGCILADMHAKLNYIAAETKKKKEGTAATDKTEKTEKKEG